MLDGSAAEFCKTIAEIGVEGQDEPRQEFVVDLELGLDLSVAGASDDLAATVDYGALAEAVVARISGPAFDLIERLAEVVAQDALAHDRVGEVTVTVHKPQAPIEAEFGDVTWWSIALGRPCRWSSRWAATSVRSASSWMKSR